MSGETEIEFLKSEVERLERDGKSMDYFFCGLILGILVGSLCTVFS